MWNIIAAAAAKQVLGKKEQPSGVTVINQAARKRGWYIFFGVTAVVALSILIYRIYRAIAVANARKLDEARDAESARAIMKKTTDKKTLWYYINPMTAINPFPAIYDVFVGENKGKLVDELKTIRPKDIAELRKAYKGLYASDLDKDLQFVAGEQYPEIMDAWSKTDIQSTGWKTSDGKIVVKDGKKITSYSPGSYAEYADKFALVTAKTDAVEVVVENNSIKFKKITLKKGNYAGRASGFRLLNQNYPGGTIFKDAKSNIVGIYLLAPVNGVNQSLGVKTSDILLFDTVAELNAYADSKGISVTPIQ